MKTTHTPDVTMALKIPGYRIKNIIDEGGMAIVYLAEHVLLKQERALKVMSSSLTSQPGFKESFIREGQIVAALRHPNIVSIHDIKEHEGVFYMDMEYLQGGNLAERLSTSPLDLGGAIKILEQIGSALHYAHQQNFIHRDIKPANILFNSQGSALLTDFGISKLQDTESDLSLFGYGLMGTLRYMSPEQTGGQKLDQRSDLYSLALVFYEMLSGEKAIKSTATATIIQEHALAPPPELPPKYHFLQAALNKALAKTTDERYPDIPVFLKAVKSAQMSEDETIVQPIAPEAEKPKKSKLFRLFISLLLIGIAGAVWKIVLNPQQALVSKSQAPAELKEPVAAKLQQHPANSEKPVVIPLQVSTKVEKPVVQPLLSSSIEQPVATNQPQLSSEEKTVATQPLTNAEKPKKELPTKSLNTEPVPNKTATTQESVLSTASVEPTPAKIQNTEIKVKELKPIFKVVKSNPYTIVYAEPNTNKSLMRVAKGTLLKVIGSQQASDGKIWNKVEFKKIQGFVKSNQLEGK